MTWDDCLKHYHHLLIGLNQARIVTAAAQSVLKDFPKGLPEQSSKRLGDAINLFSRGLTEGSSSSEEGKVPHIPDGLLELANLLKECEQDPHGRVVEPAILLLAFGVIEGTVEAHMNLTPRIRAQHLVMVFAHLDAYLADVVRCVCYARPDILKSNRQLTWESAISMGDWDSILDYFVDKYVFEFGHPPLVARLDTMEKTLGFTLNLSAERLVAVARYEDLRNLVVHAGGKIGSQFVQSYGVCHGEVGSIAQITELHCDELYDLGMVLGEVVALSAAEAHFGMNRSEVTRVLRRA